MESTSEVVTNSVADKSVCVEGSAKNTEAEQQSVAAEVTATIKVHATEDKKSKVVEETVAEKKEVEQTKESSASDQEEVEEVVEEVVVEDCDEAEDGVNETVTEKVIDTTDGNQTKTITVTTVEKVTPAGIKSVVTTTSVTKEVPTATTTIITTLPTPTTEEIKTLTTDVEKVESNENEEEEEEEEEEVTEDEEDEDAEEEDDKKIVKATDLKKSKELPQQQQLHKDQIVQEAESQPKEATPVKEETVVDAPSIAPQSHEQENNKQDNLNNTLKDIISSIDSNIKAEENIAALKERELELLKKQQELSREIEQQKLLAQKLASENQTQQQINNNFTYQQQSNIIPKTYIPITNVSKYSTFEEKQDENVYSRKSETFKTTESTNVSKKIDLDKIFKPATDSEEILPKNRKLYASSAFYSPSLHPTVEDQVELARRISHSLSDISNQQSRGQSMYVNRKKRSVKWVHEGCGQEEDENITITNQNEYQQEEKENNVSHHEKVPLKFLMNPSGQMRDINSIRESINTETGLLSPDVSAEVMTALQAQKGRGAELFAKRRKVSEKWVVDESNVGAQSPSGLPDYHQYQQQPRPSTSPSILPAYTDAAKHRVQLNLHQEQLLEKYAKPGLKVVQTPWEAALNSGSASAAFVEEQKLSPYPTSTLTPSPTPQLYDASQGGAPLQSAPTETGGYSKPFYTPDCPKYQAYTAPAPQAQHEPQLYSGNNLQRELAYKPSIPQGWKAPSMSLPKDLYMPKEIPLQSYAPPPVAAIPSSVSPFSSNLGYESSHNSTYKPLSSSPLPQYSMPESTSATNKAYGSGNTFPISKPNQQGFASSYGSNQPPKQQYLPPQSYQTRTENTSQNIPQVNFNPSPLPYDKLAKFENQPADEGRYNNSPPSRNSHLNVRGANKVRNVSPAPFGGFYNRPCTASSDTHYYGGTPSPASPRPLSSIQQYSGHNTPNLTHTSVTSTQILNAPSYNTSARGWGCSGGTASYQQHPRSHLSGSKPQIINAASMPYTDF